MLLIISGPSGVGKSTITNRILERLGATLSVSMTTRKMRPGDVDGEHYHFVDDAAFEAMVAADGFLEHAVYAGNKYGTPRGPVEALLGEGGVMVLEIDVAGAAQVKGKMPGAFAVFVEAPTREALLHRLRTRSTEDEATIQRRFGIAQREIEFAHASGLYDAFVVNDDLERAVGELAGLVEGALAGGRGAGPGVATPGL